MLHVVVFLSLVEWARAAVSGGFLEVLNSGDIIIINPTESGLIFLGVIVVAAILEFCLDRVGDIENKYFHVMFEAMAEEIMIVGLLSLMIKFGEGIIALLKARYFIIFEWAHMCLFFMAVTFLTIILLVLLVTGFNNKKWAEFESKRLEEDTSTHNPKEKDYKKSYYKFLTTLEAYGFTSDQGIQFHVYLLKMERRNVVELTDLTWKSWLSLSTLVMLNAFRTRLTPTQGEDPVTGLPVMDARDRLFNYLSYIVCCGYGTLIMFIFIHHMLQNRLSQFLHSKMDQGDQSGSKMNALGQRLLNKDDLEDPQTFLPWQNKESTLELLQMVIMFFEWYLSVFILSFTWSIWTYVLPLMAPIFVFALFPVVVFLYIFPWTLTTVTILSSLGASLDEGLIRTMVERAEEERAAKAAKTAGPKDAAKTAAAAPTKEDHPRKKELHAPVDHEDDGAEDGKYFLRKKRFPHRDKLAQKLAVKRGYASLEDPWPDNSQFSPKSPPVQNRGDMSKFGGRPINIPGGDAPMTRGRYSPPSFEMQTKHGKMSNAYMAATTVSPMRAPSMAESVRTEGTIHSQPFTGRSVAIANTTPAQEKESMYLCAQCNRPIKIKPSDTQLVCSCHSRIFLKPRVTASTYSTN